MTPIDEATEKANFQEWVRVENELQMAADDHFMHAEHTLAALARARKA